MSDPPYNLASFGSLAQLVEQRTFNPLVAGSNPARPTTLFPAIQRKHAMTYEEFLDEVTTLLTELYDLDDAAAIKLVVDAQAADFFVAHDDKEELRTVAQAKLDAATLYQAKQNKNQTQRKQQQRHTQKKKTP
jgi:hypothetical protein